jgi:hypothetical protein
MVPRKVGSVKKGFAVAGGVQNLYSGFANS